MTGTSKNDIAWKEILAENPQILRSVNETGFFDVSADMIRQHREPRLACYMNFREHRPKPFKEHDLSILAINNGRYRLARTDPFIDLSSQMPVRNRELPRFKIPQEVTLLNPTNLSSESKALDAALVSGILNEVFEDEVSLVLRGREFSSNFSFNLPVVNSNNNDMIKYEIDHVTIEVDGGYEGNRGLYLVEAKCTSMAEGQSGMSCRQLLYPHLNYGERLNKSVSTYLMLFEPRTCVYLFYKFHPDSKGARGNILEYRYKCQLESTKQLTCRYRDLFEVNASATNTNNLAPFPQADRFERVIDAYRHLAFNGPTEKDKIISDNLDPRQFRYYIDALIWMKLAHKTESNLIELTNRGLLYRVMDDKNRLFEFAKIVVSNDVFHAALRGEGALAKQMMREYRVNSERTIERRMQTVKSWLKYFESVLDKDDHLVNR